MKKILKKIKFWWHFPDQWPKIWGDILIRLNSTYTLNDEIRADLLPELKKCMDYIKKDRQERCATIQEAPIEQKNKRAGGKNAK